MSFPRAKLQDRINPSLSHGPEGSVSKNSVNALHAVNSVPFFSCPEPSAELKRFQEENKRKVEKKTKKNTMAPDFYKHIAKVCVV